MTTAHPLSIKVKQLQKELEANFLEREDAIEAMILAVLSGEHIFMLGVPGTTKSRLTRALISAIVGARYFETPLSKQRPAEAVLGPLDIMEFRENGNYFLKRTGFASQVEFCFLDEIGKMSPILGHDLLALANERVYHEVNGGNSVHPAPLSTLFSASNEVLTDQSEDAAALWDRLLFRVVVDSIQSDENFAKLLRMEVVDPDTKIAWEDLKDVIDNVVPNIPLSDKAVNALVGLRNAMRREGIQPSDRRWKNGVKALQAHAFLDGRSEVLDADIEALRFVLWDTPQQIEKVERLCLAAANPFYEPIMRLRDMLAELEQGIDERTDQSIEIRGEYAKELTKKLRMARDQLTTIQMEAGGAAPATEKVETAIKGLLKRSLIELMDQDPDAAEIGAQQIWDKR